MSVSLCSEWKVVQNQDSSWGIYCIRQSGATLSVSAPKHRQMKKVWKRATDLAHVHRELSRLPELSLAWKDNVASETHPASFSTRLNACQSPFYCFSSIEQCLPVWQIKPKLLIPSLGHLWTGRGRKEKIRFSADPHVSSPFCYVWFKASCFPVPQFPQLLNEE